jgi:DNA-binding transcriptional LysR family regulator
MKADLRSAMSSRWDDVRYFLAVMREGSFTLAARALGTDQSTVSRRIAALEDALGVALFERARRAPIPTEAAERLRDSAERIEAEMGRFTDQALGIHTQAVAGRVRIALTEEIAIQFLVPEVLPALRERYPDLALDLITGYRAADLVTHEADIALRFFQTERGDLVGRRIARFSTAILCARRHAKRVRARPLRELDWISVELAGMKTPESAWLEAHVDRTPSMVCTSYQVQIALIRAGLGVGIGPRVLAKIDRDFVVLERSSAALPSLELFVVTRRAIRTLPRIAVVIDALADALGALGDRSPR